MPDETKPAAGAPAAPEPKKPLEGTIESDRDLTPAERARNRREFMESNGFTYEPTDEEKAGEAEEKVKADAESAKTALTAEEVKEKVTADAAKAEADEKAKKEKEDKAKAAKAKKAGEGKPGTPSEETPPEEEEEPKPKRRRKPAPVDLDELATKTAEKVIERTVPPAAAAPPAPKVDPDADLAPAARKELRVLAKMAELNPGVGDMAGKMRSFWQQERKYKADWETQNPGSEFDDTDSVHDKFYEREPKYDQTLYEDASEALQDERVKKLAHEQAKEIIDKTIEPHLAKQRADEAFNKAMPEVAKQSHGAVIDLVEMATPELAKLAPADKDGRPILSKEALEKMAEEHPVEFETLLYESQKLDATVSELLKVDRLGNLYPVNPRFAVNLGTESDPQLFYPHQAFLQFIAQHEARLMHSPVEQQMWNGKRFLPLGQYTALQDRIDGDRTATAAQKQAQQADIARRFWTYETEDWVNFLVKHHADEVKNQIRRVNTMAEKRAGKKAPGTEELPPKPALEEEPKPAPAARRERPPSSASASDVVNTEKIGKTNQITQEEAVRATWE